MIKSVLFILYSFIIISELSSQDLSSFDTIPSKRLITMIVIVNDTLIGDSNYVFLGEVNRTIKSQLKSKSKDYNNIYYHPPMQNELFYNLLKQHAVVNLPIDPYRYAEPPSEDHKLNHKRINAGAFFTLDYSLFLSFIGLSSQTQFNNTGVYLKFFEVESRLIYKDVSKASNFIQFYTDVEGKVPLNRKLNAIPLRFNSTLGLLY